jgi:hypothetical protein
MNLSGRTKQIQEHFGKGRSGCIPASVIVPNAKAYDLRFVDAKNINELQLKEIENKAAAVAVVFEETSTLDEVRSWCCQIGFYEIDIDAECVGLRREIEDQTAWVTYIGSDSHVLTRRCPIPAILYKTRPESDSFHRTHTESKHLHLA